MTIDFTKLQSLYNSQIDMLLAKTGLATKCLLNYGITKKDLCPNCIYDPILKKSANKYKIGGPKPFVNGRICPYCNGAGYNGSVKVDEVYLAIIWDYKYWINKPINVQNPTGMIQTICHRSLLDRIKRAKDLTVIYTTNNSNPLFKLAEEPNPNGLGDNNYLICNWEKTGFSTITESMVTRPVLGYNSANYAGPLGNIMFDVGTNGGPSAYGTYDQTGNAEEWTGTREGVTSPIYIKVAGGYAGSDANSLVKGGVYGALESGTRYRGFRVATLSNPNSYNNFVLVDDKYNRSDANGYGGVNYDYYIGKYEITIKDWCDFVNSVASYTTSSGVVTNIDRDIVDPGSLWGNPEITSDTYGILNNSFFSRVDYVAPTAFPGNYTFTPQSGFADHPITNVTWLDSLRYCNWLHNSKPSGYQTLNNDGVTPNIETTEAGAYGINGATALSSFINSSSAAKYRLPTIHEWYKAAYYKNDPSSTSLACSLPDDGYWNYATQRDELPQVVNTSTTDDIAIQFVYDTSLGDPSQTGVVVLPLSNPVDVVVDWGDGTVESFDTDGQKTHTYSTNDEYTVKIVGRLNHLNNKLSFTRDSGVPPLVYSHQDKLVECRSFGETGLDSLERFFYGCSSLTTVPDSLPVSVNSLREAFAYATDYNVDSNGSGLLAWDTSNITDMTYLFRYAIGFNQDISGWDVSKATNLSGMFRDALDFNQNINDWNVSSVQNMSEIFRNATSFNQPLDSWNVGNVTDMSFAFTDADNFNQDISSWDVSSVINFAYMFAYNDFDYSINSWNTSSAIYMGRMFQGNNTYNQSLSLWDVSNVQDMQYMFSGASAFNRTIDNWNVGNVTNMTFMLAGTTSFNQPLNSWDVSNVTSMEGMFKNSGFNRSLNNWNVSSVTDMDLMFSYSQFNQDISSWDVSNVTSMARMFNFAYVFNQDLSSWCVTNIASEPVEFDLNAINWALPRPVWGTCP